MRKLPEVSEARELMTQAMGWSTFKWLFEKPKVRATADRANAALDRMEKSVKAQWSEEFKSAHKSLSGKSRSHQKDQQTRHVQPADPQINLLIEKIIEADKAAHRARMDAEEAFDKAEKQMNLSLAREGCKKAIHSWELHEKAIRQAEALMKPAPEKSTPEKSTPEKSTRKSRQRKSRPVDRTSARP
jgi:hypothetical protein